MYFSFLNVIKIWVCNTVTFTYKAETLTVLGLLVKLSNPQRKSPGKGSTILTVKHYMCGPRTVPPANAKEWLVLILYTDALFESSYHPHVKDLISTPYL